MGSSPPNSTTFASKNLLIGKFNTTGNWTGDRCCGNCPYQCIQAEERTVYSTRNAYAYGGINYLGVAHINHASGGMDGDDDEFILCISQIDATIVYQRDSSKFWAILSLSLLIICSCLMLGVIVAIVKARRLREANAKLLSEATPLVFPGSCLSSYR